MPQISAIFWDVGGVLLTNAWDRSQRERALEQFKLDKEEFQDRHEMLVSSLERGKIGFDEYLDRTIFYRPRPFAREVFKDYIFSLSQPHHKVLALVFVSSCFVGLRKPEPTIYRLALELTQKSPEDCCFIDDRALNLESARQLGMHPIEMKDVEQLRRDLRKLEVEI